MKESRAAPRSAIELLDDAVHLLRRAGPGSFATWCLGSGPFVLGALVFWTEMSAGAAARGRLLLFSLVLATLYLWMKTLHGHFAGQLRAIVGGRQPTRRSLGGWISLAAISCRLQPTALVALPLSVVAAVPLAWVYAFYHSLSVTGSAPEAQRQAMLWPRQNHVLLAVLTLLAVVIVVNALMVVILVPWLLQTFLGVETAMSRSPVSQLNTTTLAVAWAISYLVLGPVVKAAYVLRCFDGASVTSGEDLLVTMSELGGDRR